MGTVMNKSKKKSPIRYSSIQIRKEIKNQIVDHCDKTGLKIGKYIEKLFLFDVSGSATISTDISIKTLAK